MKTYIVMSGLLAFFLVACNSGKIDQHGNAQEIMLNQGAKWQANPETTTGISNMKLLVTDFMKGQTKDCDGLRSALQAEFESIIQQCTMTGEAHEQLHHYLIPLQEKIGKIKGKSADDCKVAVESLNDFLSTYDQYFV